MSLFTETICIQKGKIHQLDFHQQRFNRTRFSFFPLATELKLKDYIIHLSTETPVKCRVVYGEEIVKVSYTPYIRKKIESLKVIHSEIDYSYKWEDRHQLNQLYAQKGSADDILIIKDGKVTDTYYGNIAFRKDSNGQWYTPSEPLLKGTTRQSLLDTGKIKEAMIKEEEIWDYTEVSIFNAMIPLASILFSTRNIIK